jgi:hypothetical protein
MLVNSEETVVPLTPALKVEEVRWALFILTVHILIKVQVAPAVRELEVGTHL